MFRILKLMMFAAVPVVALGVATSTADAGHWHYQNGYSYYYDDGHWHYHDGSNWYRHRHGGWQYFSPWNRGYGYGPNVYYYDYGNGPFYGPGYGRGFRSGYWRGYRRGGLSIQTPFFGLRIRR